MPVRTSMDETNKQLIGEVREPLPVRTRVRRNLAPYVYSRTTNSRSSLTLANPSCWLNRAIWTMDSKPGRDAT